MSAIFISHSSHDRERAIAVKACLEGAGHTGVFLDVDAADGIVAGQNWEKTLYQKLRACRAVILLLSDRFLASHWCFAEMAIARKEGKVIFPVKIDPWSDDAQMPGVLALDQQLDLRSDPQDGYRRLLAGLERIQLREWPVDRCPFPGLFAYDEEDAAVFFGRERETDEAVELLNSVRRSGGPGLVLVIGSSGSGKSSVVRAGLIPRLRRYPREWLIAGPLRPGPEPTEALAAALGDTFECSWTDVHREMADSGDLATVCRRLRLGTPRKEATVLVVVDQFEEALAHEPGHPADRFLQLLRSGLESEDSPVLVLATIRSDFLTAFQQNTALRGLGFRSFSLGPMAQEELPKVLREPLALSSVRLEDGQVVAVEMEEGLLEMLVRDTSSADALPLLAFTLRELWDTYAADGLIEIREYREIGGLAGAIAKKAEIALTMARERGQEDEVRSAFLAMVRIDEEAQYAQRTIVWDQLPESVHPVLDNLVKSRLLVSGWDGSRRTLEPAHEALFHAWDKLDGWLKECSSALILHRELVQAASQWEQNDHGEEYLWRGGRMLRACELRAAGVVPMDDLELRFLEHSEQAERGRERRKARRRRVVVVAAVLVAVVMTLLMVRAEQAKRAAIVNQLLMASAAERTDHPLLASLLAVEAARRSRKPEAHDALFEALAGTCPSTALQGHTAAIRYGAWSPDGTRVLTASEDGTARLWDLEGNPIGSLAGHDGGEVSFCAWSPDGTRILIRSGWDTGLLWDSEGHRIAALGSDVMSGAWSPDGRRVLTTHKDETARIWDADGNLLGSVTKHTEWESPAKMNLWVWHGTWSPDGTRFVTAHGDTQAHIWDLDGNLLDSFEFPGLRFTVWSPTENRILAISEKRTAHVWDPEGGRVIPLVGHDHQVRNGAWSPDGTRIATVSIDNTARIWDLDGNQLVCFQGHDAPVDLVAWSPDGNRLLSVSGLGGTARIWDRNADQHAALEGAFLHGAWSPDGRRVLTVSADQTARIWDLEGPRLASLRGHTDSVDAGAWSPDGSRILTTSEDSSVRIWDAQGNQLAALWGHPSGGLGGKRTLVAWGPAGDRILTLATDGTARLWDGQGNLQATLDERCRHGAWNPQADRLLTVSREDATVRIWDQDGKAIRSLDQQASHHAAWDPHGQRILTLDRKQGVRIVDLRGEVLSSRAECPWGEAAWSPDGDRILAYSQETAHVLDPRLNDVAALPGPTVRHCAWSPDGEQILCVYFEEMVRILDRDGNPSATLEGHRESVMHGAWSPDGTRIVTVSLDDTVRIWDAQGNELACLRGHASSVRHGAWSPDGSRILTSSSDNTARIWLPVSLADLAERRIPPGRYERELDGYLELD